MSSCRPQWGIETLSKHTLSGGQETQQPPRTYARAGRKWRARQTLQEQTAFLFPSLSLFRESGFISNIMKSQRFEWLIHPLFLSLCLMSVYATSWTAVVLSKPADIHPLNNNALISLTYWGIDIIKVFLTTRFKLNFDRLHFILRCPHYTLKYCVILINYMYLL